MISTLVPSLIRTYVPILVGGFIAWLVTRGVELDPTAEQGLTVAFTGILIAAYYTLIRLLEKKFPWVSVLLGSKQIPAQYTTSGEPVVEVVPALMPPDGSAEPGAGNYPGRGF